ncbi:hypothetical protein I3760_07G231500 [Carya illinoinensis]|uniref:Uncharacterized protein n=1 Tax=Carya illinoinensis TaxID=32201 RepID=A0A8T1Q4J6_CARIL|nr:uncharacterized protein LOC122315479 [Carya illinoinensis]KAG2700460.1 hypothetical protein I3760_07G231500 [Carya illinoinensis]KAG6649808.1 hypothetical protein CIPAW_07G236300 [Carya illinoinensis]KAG6706768.1 hypothetical protein I3842_07G237900 [Carya illinoinensis]
MYKTTHSCGNPAFSTPNDTVPTTLLPPPIPNPPPLNEEQPPCHHPTPTNTAPFMLSVAAVASWLGSRRIRYCLLLLCSPLLLPCLCAAFPLICAAEICLRRRIRRRKAAHGSQEEEPLRRCEEGCGCGVVEEDQGVGLLQRYLEDQMLLVGSVYDCGDEDDDGPSGGSRTPLLG